jgi:hypothetical protein
MSGSFNAIAHQLKMPFPEFRRPRVGDSFLGWTLRRWFTYLLIAINFARLAPFVPNLSQQYWVQWLIDNNDIVQIWVIGGMLLATLVLPFVGEGYLDRAAEQPELTEAVHSTRTFYWFWFATLAAWLGFYIVFHLVKSSANVAPFRGVLDAVNALEAVFFLFAYAEMTTITVSKAGIRTHAARVWAVCIIASYMLFLAVVFWSGNPWMSVASGLAVGVAMALLVGRFESHLIRAPFLLTASLFLYAVIQVLYPLFPSSDLMEHFCHGSTWELCPQLPTFQNIVTFVSLFLKCLMFLAVDWMYFGGRLLFYMYRARGILHDDTEWAEFLEKVRA